MLSVEGRAQGSLNVTSWALRETAKHKGLGCESYCTTYTVPVSHVLDVKTFGNVLATRLDLLVMRINELLVG